MDLLEQLKKDDFDQKRAAIVEISKLDDLDSDRLKLLYAQLQKLQESGDKALSFFVKKAMRNLEKIEKLKLSGIKNEKPVHNLEENLNSPDPDVRLNALFSIENSESPIDYLPLLEKFAAEAEESEAVRAAELILKISPQYLTVAETGLEIHSTDISEDAAVSAELPSEEKVTVNYRKKKPYFLLITGIFVIFFSVFLYFWFRPEQNRVDVIPEKKENPAALFEKSSREYVGILSDRKMDQISVIFPGSPVIEMPQCEYTVAQLLNSYVFGTEAIVLAVLGSSKGQWLLTQRFIFSDGKWTLSGNPSLEHLFLTETHAAEDQ